MLLRNENVLFGVARQVGQFVIVETGQGGEIQLPRQEVLCWADSLRHLYRYRVDHRQPGDLSALLRDARWCLRYDLYELAAKEIRGVWAIDPNNAEASLIEDQLRRQASASRKPASSGPESDELDPPLAAAVDESAETEAAGPIKIVAYSGQDEKGQPVRGAELISDSLTSDELAADARETPVEVDLPTLRRFASQVQPLLINRCGRCHDAAIGDRAGWKIELPPIGSRSSARMTRENVATALRYVDPVDPAQSLLFSKATSAHGGGESPLHVHDAKAIEALKGWLWAAAASLGSMEPSRRASTNRRTPRRNNRTQSANTPRRMKCLKIEPAAFREVQRDFHAWPIHSIRTCSTVGSISTPPPEVRTPPREDSLDSRFAGTMPDVEFRGYLERNKDHRVDPW